MYGTTRTTLNKKTRKDTQIRFYKAMAVPTFTYGSEIWTKTKKTNILHKRLEPYAEETLGDYQCGFRTGRSTTNQLFTLRLVLEKAHEFGIDLHLLFIAFKQACDTVDRKYLFEVLKEFGIPKKLVNLIKMTLKDSTCRVKIQGQLSSIFKVKVGFWQGDALPTIA
jgi:sorting nexin-29